MLFTDLKPKISRALKTYNLTKSLFSNRSIPDVLESFLKKDARDLSEQNFYSLLSKIQKTLDDDEITNKKITTHTELVIKVAAAFGFDVIDLVRKRKKAGVFNHTGFYEQIRSEDLGQKRENYQYAIQRVQDAINAHKIKPAEADMESLLEKRSTIRRQILNFRKIEERYLLKLKQVKQWPSWKSAFESPDYTLAYAEWSQLNSELKLFIITDQKIYHEFLTDNREREVKLSNLDMQIDSTNKKQIETLTEMEMNLKKFLEQSPFEHHENYTKITELFKTFCEKVEKTTGILVMHQKPKETDKAAVTPAYF